MNRLITITLTTIAIFMAICLLLTIIRQEWLYTTCNAIWVVIACINILLNKMHNEIDGRIDNLTIKIQ